MNESAVATTTKVTTTSKKSTAIVLNRVKPCPHCKTLPPGLKLTWGVPGLVCVVWTGGSSRC